MLNRFIKNPFTNLLSGIILLVSSGYEVWSTIDEFTVGAHHGILLFSIVHILKSLPEVLQGTKEINVAVKSA